MSASATMTARYGQMFPQLDAHDIARLRRFGETGHFSDGTRIVEAGKLAPGLLVILSGKIAVSQGGQFADHAAIVEHGPGNFLGELAQLSDRPALVDANAVGAVEAIVIPPRALRDLLVQEAELGERLMRALILRRVGLLETGQAGSHHHRPGRQWRCAAVGKFPGSQRPSASIPGFRD